MCVCTCAVWIYIWRPEVTIRCLLQSLITYFLRQGLSPNLELIDSARQMANYCRDSPVPTSPMMWLQASHRCWKWNSSPHIYTAFTGIMQTKPSLSPVWHVITFVWCKCVLRMPLTPLKHHAHDPQNVPVFFPVQMLSLSSEAECWDRISGPTS